MSEPTNLWNKKNVDLTVGDSVKVNVLTPVITIVATAAATAAVAGVQAGIRKFRNRKSDKTETEA